MSEHECHVDAQLTHSCRLMLGAHAAGYDGVPDNFDAQHLAHTKRIGRSLDFVHAFAKAGDLPFSDRHVNLWTRSRRDSYIIHNWKPLVRWADAGTPEAANHFKLAARRVAYLRRPVIIVIHPEPENDLAQPGVRKRAFGTPEQYRHMWRIVREIFDEAGATNVRWGMAYMNYPKWDSVVADLWPGDEAVDWLWFNAYGSPERPHIDDNIAHFADLADTAGIAQDLPWGIIEWGITGTARDVAVDYFTEAARFLDTDLADRLRAWVVFDSPGAHRESGLRLAYDDLGRTHTEKLAAYKTFTHHPKFSCDHVHCDRLPKPAQQFGWALISGEMLSGHKPQEGRQLPKREG